MSADRAQGLSTDQLARAVAPHLGVEAGELRFSPCGAGKYNTSFFIEGAGRPLVLRVAPPDDRSQNLFYEHRMMRQEPGLHAVLLERTSVPVPRILAHDESHAVIDRDLLIMQRMPGEPISRLSLSRDATARLLRQVGKALRAVHAIRGDAFGYVGEHRPMAPQKSWPDAFRIMWNSLLDDIERCGGYAPDEAAQMRSLPDRHAGVFDRPVEACLLHMDVWAENILSNEQGRLTALIDWDRALWGDPEIEFAVLDYCGVSEEPFWEGYGRRRDTSQDAQTRRIFYLLYELQKYIFIRRIRGGSAAGADRYRMQSLRLADEVS